MYSGRTSEADQNFSLAVCTQATMSAPPVSVAADSPAQGPEAPFPIKPTPAPLLALAALGVVYGDIGTSPLYAIRACFSQEYGVAVTRGNVFGLLSLVTWSLVLVVAIKYLAFIIRADNKGEGGILALMALVLQRRTGKAKSLRRSALIAMGLFGAALLYGDGIITPPVSVLGAMEGLTIVAPHFEHFVVPVSFLILLALFLVQHFGTARVGFAFGPVVLIWFLTIALLGAVEIVRSPSVLLSVSPWYAIRFMSEHAWAGFVILGAVVLVITGAEALYADLGHFGRRVIRLDFFAIVLPALLLNYFGQGALILRDPTAADNPFYRLAPPWFGYALIVIATAAAIIASQAMISAAFSIARQAVQLGYMPRLKVVHTSAREVGQIYIPEINFGLMLGCLTLVATFRSAEALASAYGIAVMGTMVTTTTFFAVVAYRRRGWTLAAALGFLAVFLTIDLAFLGANLLKMVQGGWVPLAVGAALFVLMTTWKRGRELLVDTLYGRTMPLELLIQDVIRSNVGRVPGTAVFMTSRPGGTPVVLLHHLKHNKLLHEEVILLSVQFAEVPHVDGQGSIEVQELGHGFWNMTAMYGFMQQPDVPRVIERARAFGIRAPAGDTSYYLGREQLIVTHRGGMAKWRKRLFMLMSRNARPATDFFCLPPNRVVELGAQIEF